MLEKFKYINHMGEVLEFGGGSLFANENELRDYEWEVLSVGDKISGFKRGIVNKSIPVIIKCDTAEKGIEMRNKLFEIAEKDILANKAGKFVINDYYLRGFVAGSTKSEYLYNKQYMKCKLLIQTDATGWIKETVYPFRLAKAAEGEKHLDFPYDMPFDYGNSLALRTLNNPAFVAADFRLIIYGNALNPSIYVGDNVYSVDVEINSGEYLTIDSKSKTIVLTKIDGQKVNCYNRRNREKYIFTKIPTGNSIVTSPNDGIAFDLVVLEERSEPKWI